MATFKISIFEHQRRRDGKYPVSIRCYWKGSCAYIGTEYYVTDKQILRKKLSKKDNKKEILQLKDIFIVNELNKRIARFEDIKSRKLGHRIELYTAKELAKYFIDETRPGTDTGINFVEFAVRHIERLMNQGRGSTARSIRSTINSLVDFAGGRERIAVTEITAKFLTQFENYLRGKRTLKRKNQFGKTVVTKKAGLSDVSILDNMANIRIVFNAAMDEYNDEDKGEIRIMHYPFRKYKLKRRPESDKRNLTPEQIAAIRDVSNEKLVLERAIFSRDVFMLSFYLVGMNLADMYDADHLPDARKMIRIQYNRKKTKRRRQDKALISIKVEPEALPLLTKYRDPTGERVFDFHNRYTNSHIFSSNVNKGLKIVAKAAGIDEPLSTYYARHSWATIARNKCNISKDDVDLALNHIDQGRKMADVYIEKDWSMVDRANRAVIDLIHKTQPVNNV